MNWFLNWVKDRKDEKLYAATAQAFLKNGEEIYKPGETWEQPDLAKTLKRIQKNGADGFYKGKTAKLIADFYANTWRTYNQRRSCQI